MQNVSVQQLKFELTSWHQMADGDQGNNPDFNEGAGEDENVDQYFDDGGETFLPADHVSWRICK